MGLFGRKRRNDNVEERCSICGEPNARGRSSA
jgi:hypothetical protein